MRKAGRSASSSSNLPPRRRRSPATSATATSSSRASATSATFRTVPPTSPRQSRTSPGPGSASTSTTTSRRSTSSTRTRRRVVAELKRKLKDADELLLATDEDREGEAIAWHLLEVLKPKVPVKRMVFHEITKDAIERALGETRDIDERLVDAQETRRILDRLYGYEVSPVLWKKVMRGLSAGRVQSVATRLVVERERERMAFVAAEYWDIVGDASTPARSRRGSSRWRAGASRTGRDFGARRRARATSSSRSTSGGARRSPTRSTGAPFAVRSVEREAVHAPARAAVHDLDAAAGGEPQAALRRADDDARRPAPLRAGLHHLHAHRLDHAVRVGAHGSARPGAPSCSAPSPSRPSRAAGSAR